MQRRFTVSAQDRLWVADIGLELDATKPAGDVAWDGGIMRSRFAIRDSGIVSR